MAHSHEELLLKLLASLQHQQVLVFVHIDKKSQALFEKLSKQPGIQLIQNRVNVQWAHISQVEAVFTSYKEIKAAGYGAGHWIVISGQDYPVQAINKPVHFLSSQPTKSFIGFSPLSKEGWPTARKRYRYHYYIPKENLERSNDANGYSPEISIRIATIRRITMDQPRGKTHGSYRRLLQS